MNQLFNLLENHASGTTLATAETDLKNLIRSVEASGGQGAIVISVKVSRKGEGVIRTAVEAKVKLPKAEVEETIFFTNDQGELSRERPGQTVLPFGQAAGV